MALVNMFCSFGMYYVFLTVLITVSMTTAQEEIEESDFLGNLDVSEIEEKDLNPSTNDVRLQCHTSSMCVILNKQWLNTQWGIRGKEQLSLRQRCDESVEENGTHITLCTEKGRLTSCGSQFKQNETHAFFGNNVHILLPSPTRIVPTVRASIPWTCTYPMKVLVGVNFVPEISPVTVFLGNKTGYGEFEAAMFLYKDDSFKKAYEMTPKLHITDRLRVKVQLLRGPDASRVQVVKCWGTPVAYPREEDLSYTLIDDFCPSEEGAQADVKLSKNGQLQHALWESNVFRFVVSPEVYIHCHIKVCFDGTKCEKKCPYSGVGRKRREVEEVGNGVLTLGPLNIAEDVPEVESSLEAPEQEKAKETSPEDIRDSYILGMPKIAIFAIVAGLAAICFISIIAVSIVVYKKTKRTNEKKTAEYWKQQTAARCRLSARFTLSNSPPFEIPISVPNTIALPDRRGSNNIPIDIPMK